MADKRKYNRRPFTHYMQVLDEDTGHLVGYLSDISMGGFRLDCEQRVPVGHDFQLAIQLNNEIADKMSLVLIARSRWCRPAYIDPTTFKRCIQIWGIPDREQTERRTAGFQPWMRRQTA